MNMFNKIAIPRIPKNTFDLSHERKLTAQMGVLTPILNMEVVPGDVIKSNTEIILRMAPMLAPIMHRLHVSTHFFFVPNRLVWDEWEDFITGGPDGTSTPIPPHYLVHDAEVNSKPLFSKGSLSDHLGIPLFADMSITDFLKVSSIPHRAYQLIWNEYYRDQNLQDPIDIPKTSNYEGTLELLRLRNRCWEKDYFTSCLPWAQKGEEVQMPFEPVYKDISEMVTDQGVPATGTGTIEQNAASAGNLLVRNSVSGLQTGRIENLESGAGVTINDLRTATRLQAWLERNARGGSRYIEQIMAHFRVKSSDSRLQRPEYLGGGRQPISVSEVLSTVGTDAVGIEAPQGNMAGHGISVGNTNRFKRYFEEHGTVLGLMSIMPKTAYQQGLNRQFTRMTKEDYYWPEFANLGEQEVKNQEVYIRPDAAYNEGTFGYQSRYAEYKYMNSSVHGDMRDNMDFWHMGRIFDSQPSLNEDFVKANPTKRIFAVDDPDEASMFIQIYNDVKAKRPMPYFGTPQL